MTSKPGIQDQLREYVLGIIEKYGLGHVVSAEEIKDAIRQRYGTNKKSIIPSDYCYNRSNKGDVWNNPLFFMYKKEKNRKNYRVVGEGYPYTGPVYWRPRGSEEKIIGECINGNRKLLPSSRDVQIYPDELPDDSREYREGKKKFVSINIYERNPLAREKCIQHYGAKCHVCGFDFGEVYGADCEGMIHVHHLRKISDCGEEYKVDPIEDLRPVCPNCHMVLHSKADCYTPEEVQKMVERQRQKK